MVFSGRPKLIKELLTGREDSFLTLEKNPNKLVSKCQYLGVSVGRVFVGSFDDGFFIGVGVTEAF